VEPVARALGPDDLDACLALSAEASWNQTDADWRMLFETGETQGIFLGGKLVASAGIAIHGGRIGWICMVLVTPSEQRKGLATQLLGWAIERCAARGLIAGLDATPAGRQVYEKLGFLDVYGVKRLQRGDGSKAVAVPTNPAVREAVAGDLGAIAEFDTPRFGADRSPLLERWYRRMPGLAHLALDESLVGYCLAREGRNATHVGPLVADDDATAIALFEAVLARIDGPCFIDVPDRQERLQSWLEDRGFAVQRPFTRMLIGRSEPLDRPDAIYALAGPEFS
jgi:GNAT superfamily N-acetyltransferase